MKRIFLIIILGATLLAANAAPADVRGILGALRGNKSGTDTTATTGGASNPLGALGDFLNNTLANNRFQIEDLRGTWKYESPAVSFQSDNVLQHIGGAAGATALENQIEPYYNRLGFNRSSLEVDSLDNFTLKLGVLHLKGKVEKTDDDRLQFNFNAFGRIPLGSMTANATKAGNTLNITFDASRFVTILTKVGSALNLRTLNALTAVLNSYDGLYVGFKMKRQ